MSQVSASNMPLTRTKFLRLLRSAISVSIFLLIVAYAIWRSVAYRQGPSIVISSPTDGATISSSSVQVIGQALRINSLTIDGNPLSVDESGNFKDTRAVFPGINVVTMTATDQFGRSTETQIRFVGAAR